MTPTYQALAQGSEGMRALGVVDEGAGEALRGPGWIVLLLGRQFTLYPTLALGSLFVLPLVL